MCISEKSNLITFHYLCVSYKDVVWRHHFGLNKSRPNSGKNDVLCMLKLIFLGKSYLCDSHPFLGYSYPRDCCEVAMQKCHSRRVLLSTGALLWLGSTSLKVKDESNRNMCIFDYYFLSAFFYNLRIKTIFSSKIAMFFFTYLCLLSMLCFVSIVDII